MRQFITIILLSLFGMATLAGCGERAVSFTEKASGDEQDFDTGLGDDCRVPPCGDDGDPQIGAADEVFFQNRENGRVDILIVDDNSGSMEREQELMGSRFDSFVSGLGDLDWQIGVTTTDVSDGPFGKKGALLNLTGGSGKILAKGTPGAAQIFKDTVQRPETLGCVNAGQCPSGVEEPLFATIKAINKRNGLNSGFFRDGSDLAVVVLSDEDEMSTGPAQSTKAKDVIDKFNSVWGPEKKLFVYGIVIEPGDNNCLNIQLNQTGNTAHFGNIISDLVNKTGGLTGSICDNDYSDSLKSIGENVRDLINSVELAHQPIPGTVDVTFSPAQNINWTVSGNKVIFDPAPELGTRIDVSYEYLK